jgi:hypothetical protein
MRTNRSLATLAACAIVLGAVAASACSSNPQTRVDGQVGVTAVGDHGYVSAGISVGDARLLAAQYNLTGQKGLPPGIQKNLARGKPLPPGIAKRYLPQPFVARLPQRSGYEWRQAGTDLVLVISGSMVVTDVLPGVFK